jgi:capsular polysaccharide biosynthesis protein
VAAQDRGWDTDGDGGRFVEVLERHLRTGPAPARLAVLTDGSSASPSGWSELVRAVFPRAGVTVLDVTAPAPGELHARLAAGGRYNVVVDDTSRPLPDAGPDEAPGGAEGRPTGALARVPLLQEAFLHLRPGGTLLVRHLTPTVDGAPAEALPGQPGPDVWSVVAAVLSSRPSTPTGSRDRADRVALSAAVSSLVLQDGHLALTIGDGALAKLREPEMDLVLEQRPESGSVLRVLPPVVFESRAVLRENTDVRDPLMPERYDVPAMSLREYHRPLCHPRQVVVQRNLVLPDSFRYNAAPRLHNNFLDDVGPRFANPRPTTKRTRKLSGSYFYLDSEWTRHFGHAMTEQMSRLWAAEEARRRFPGIKALVSRRKYVAEGVAEFEREIFTAAGFAESDIVLHDRPVRVEHLVAASPMFSMPTHVHPGLADLWGDLGERLAARSTGATYAPRIFCSRRRSRRLCHNLHEVEALFESHGFTVVYPEEMPFVEQVAMFRGAEVVAGFAGSALFTAAFCPTPRRMIILGPTSYPARNEYMVCAVVGHELDYVWSEPDPVEPGVQTRYAGFRFDFAREGVHLEGVLASL